MPTVNSSFSTPVHLEFVETVDENNQDILLLKKNAATICQLVNRGGWFKGWVRSWLFKEDLTAIQVQINGNLKIRYVTSASLRQHTIANSPDNPLNPEQIAKKLLTTILPSLIPQAIQEDIEKSDTMAPEQKYGSSNRLLQSDYLSLEVKEASIWKVFSKNTLQQSAALANWFTQLQLPSTQKIDIALNFAKKLIEQTQGPALSTVPLKILWQCLQTLLESPTCPPEDKNTLLTFFAKNFHLISPEGTQKAVYEFLQNMLRNHPDKGAAIVAPLLSHLTTPSSPNTVQNALYILYPLLQDASFTEKLTDMFARLRPAIQSIVLKTLSEMTDLNDTTKIFLAQHFHRLTENSRASIRDKLIPHPWQLLATQPTQAQAKIAELLLHQTQNMQPADAQKIVPYLIRHYCQCSIPKKGEYSLPEIPNIPALIQKIDAFTSSTDPETIKTFLALIEQIGLFQEAIPCEKDQLVLLYITLAKKISSIPTTVVKSTTTNLPDETLQTKAIDLFQSMLKLPNEYHMSILQSLYQQIPLIQDPKNKERLATFVLNTSQQEASLSQNIGL